MVQSMSGVTLMFLSKNIFMLIPAAFLITDRHVKSLLTVLNMDDASETDISVAFGEHLLGLLAPGKTYRWQMADQKENDVANVAVMPFLHSTIQE